MSHAEWVSGNLFIRAHCLTKALPLVGHFHNFDHTSIVFTGSVFVVKQEPVGPALVLGDRWSRAQQSLKTMEAARHEAETHAIADNREVSLSLLKLLDDEIAILKDQEQERRLKFDEAFSRVGDYVEREIIKETASHLLIKSIVKHSIRALADDTQFWCVYSHRDPQGRVIQQYDGWMQANQ